MFFTSFQTLLTAEQFMQSETHNTQTNHKQGNSTAELIAPPEFFPPSLRVGMTKSLSGRAKFLSYKPSLEGKTHHHPFSRGNVAVKEIMITTL